MRHLTRFILCFALALPVFSAPEKWKAAIDKFTTADATNPPPRDAVLFIGSSSILKWTTLAKDFPGHQVINRGFGGSELADSVYYLDRIALPYRPRVVVVYAGDNDLNLGKTPETVAGDFESFCTKIHAALPTTKIVFIGIKPSPARWKIHELGEKANTLIAAYCAKDERRTFVDTWKPMVDAQGLPRHELFVADKLHLSPEGYTLWKQLVAPHLGPPVQGGR